MTDAEATVPRFNEMINARDLDGLADLMTEDHRFVHPAGRAVSGRSACLDAWRAFSTGFPTHRNEFSSVEERAGPGRSSSPAAPSARTTPDLDGPAPWEARVEGPRVALWGVYDDTPQARQQSACDPAAQEYRLCPIGRVRSSSMEREQAPRQGDEGSPPAWLDIDPAVRRGITDLPVGTDLLVPTWLHRARRDVLATRPRDDPGRSECGVFSTRSPDRPNPIGMHRIPVVAIEGTRIGVEDLQAIDGTPIVDLKPVPEPTGER